MDIEKAIDCLKADKEYLTDMKICDGEEMDIAIKALEKLKTMECLLEKAAEEIENIYGRETEFSEKIRDLLDDINDDKFIGLVNGYVAFSIKVFEVIGE